MGIASLRRMVAGRAGFAALAGVALLVSHDAVFLVQSGPGKPLAEALRGPSHGYWGVASLGLASAGALAGLVWAIRFGLLRRRARELDARPAGGIGMPLRVARAWALLFIIVAVGFLAQENLEHLGAHGHVIGLGALLGPEYPLALPVIGVITLVGGLVAAAGIGAEQRLHEAIARTLARLRAPGTVVRPPLGIGPRVRSALADSQAVRAPPALLLANT